MAVPPGRGAVIHRAGGPLPPPPRQHPGEAGGLAYEKGAEARGHFTSPLQVSSKWPGSCLWGSEEKAGGPAAATSQVQGPLPQPPQPLWASGTPTHPRRVALNCDAWEQGGRQGVMGAFLPVPPHPGLPPARLLLRDLRAAAGPAQRKEGFPGLTHPLLAVPVHPCPTPPNPLAGGGSHVSMEMAAPHPPPLLTPTQHRTKHKQ